MTATSTLALAGAVFLLAASPGPGIASVVARALGAGLRPAMWHCLGIALGDLVLLSAACLGLAALAQHYAHAFMAVKWIGAAYLVWLGVGALRADDTPPAEIPPEAGEGGRRDALAGLLTTLGNPKPILFYAALLPALIDLDALGPRDFALTAGIVFAIVFGVLAGYALLAARARRLIRQRRTMRIAHRASALVLIGAGAAVAARSQ